jgi:heme/copper-type cytochrome/quinol oxidase subunit 2
MGLLRMITRGFINFFGITQPTEKQERQATWFICGLLVLIVLVAGGVFAMLVMGR